MKFDVVIGNPPYQDSEVGNQKNLWQFFGALGVALTPPKGYMAFVTPQNWFALCLKKYHYLKTIQLLVIKAIVGKEKAQLFPGIGSTFSYYVAQNIYPTTPTKCLQSGGKGSVDIDLTDPRVYALPTTFDPALVSLLEKTTYSQSAFPIQKVSSHHSQTTQFSEVPTAAMPYRIYRVRQDRVVYSSKEFADYEAWKVFIPESQSYRNTWVDCGCGTTENLFFLVTSSKQEALRAQAILRSPLYVTIASALKYGLANFHYTLKALPALDLTRDWTDEQIYEHFKLTPEEIAYIESTVK
jgi:site-specific DNA-methyltransferase (adenine-specific)